MTHRIYLRWPGQKVTDKTTTESAAVARFAFDELCQRPAAAGADVAWTEDGKQRDYRPAPAVDPGTNAAT